MSDFEFFEEDLVDQPTNQQGEEDELASDSDDGSTLHYQTVQNLILFSPPWINLFTFPDLTSLDLFEHPKLLISLDEA